MQGLRDLSFLSTKKKPAPADEDGRIKPAFSDVSMYSFIASLSGPETEYNRPFGMVDPGISRCPFIWSVWGKGHGFGLAKNFSKWTVTGGHWAQVRVFGVCGGISREQVNFSYHFFVIGWPSLFPILWFLLFHNSHGVHGGTAMVVPKWECEMMTCIDRSE